MLRVRVSFSKSHCFNICASWEVTGVSSQPCSSEQLILTELKSARSECFPCLFFSPSLVLCYLNISYPPERSGNFITLSLQN